MSAFNLIPFWLSAIVVFLTGAFLTKIMGVSSFWGWIAAVICGAVAWWSYGFGLKSLSSWSQRRKSANEKLEFESRIYQSFAPGENLPVGENIFYECLTCGNVVPSLIKNSAGCKCQNITIESVGRQPAIRNSEKIKVFSRKQ
jgi:hypothetical protein